MSEKTYINQPRIEDYVEHLPKESTPDQEEILRQAVREAAQSIEGLLIE